MRAVLIRRVRALEAIWANSLALVLQQLKLQLNSPIAITSAARSSTNVFVYEVKSEVNLAEIYLATFDHFGWQLRAITERVLIILSLLLLLRCVLYNDEIGSNF